MSSAVDIMADFTLSVRKGNNCSC